MYYDRASVLIAIATHSIGVYRRCPAPVIPPPVISRPDIEDSVFEYITGKHCIPGMVTGYEGVGKSTAVKRAAQRVGSGCIYAELDSESEPNVALAKAIGLPGEWMCFLRLFWWFNFQYVRSYLFSVVVVRVHGPGRIP